MSGNEAYVYTVDNQLRIELPFNSKFIKKFRKDVYNTFLWHKIEKYYYTQYSTYSLRTAIKHLGEFFTVKLSEDLERTVQLYEEHRNKCVWQPTVMRTKCGDYYVAALNESLYEKIKDFDVSIDNLQFLHTCSKLAIDVLYDDMYTAAQFFAASRVLELTPEKYNEYPMLDTIRSVLKELGIQHVVINSNVNNYVSDISLDFFQDFKVNVGDGFDSRILDGSCYITTLGNRLSTSNRVEKIISFKK